ncbi:MAG: hypothetical protein Q7R52_00155 [archaeon]|nr:hypothetical protein [archaeon]
MENKNLTCSVNGCNVNRALEDLLFCKECRINWTLYCKNMGIFDRQIEKKQLDNLLLVFQLKPQ